MDRMREYGTVLSRRTLLGVSISALLVPRALADGAPVAFCGTEAAELARLLEGSKKYTRSLPVLRHNVQQYLNVVNGRTVMECSEVRRL
ncbi:MAG: hypothetical protein RLZZ283_211, partial [Candidatus Parcubacteria bacterium]